MTFEQDLFESVRAVWPNLSVRKFSRAMGRSESYWSSVKAQKLKLSTGALMNLANTLEAKSLLATYEKSQQQLREVKRKISQQLVERFLAEVEAGDYELEELMELAQKSQITAYKSEMPLPFFMNSY